MLKYTCPCCGYKTLVEEPPDTYEFCKICYGEDDGVQYRDHDFEGGANEVSIRQAQQNFKIYRASEEDCIAFVRKPNNDSYWKSLSIKDNKNQQGYYTIKYPNSLKWFGMVITLIFSSILIALLLTTKLNHFDILGLAIVIFLFCILSISLSVVCLNWEINYTSEHFIYRTTLRKEYKFLFSDVKEYNRGTEIIVLRTDQKKLFIDPKLKNVNCFFNILEKKGSFTKNKLNEIRLSKGNFWVGLSSVTFSIFVLLLFVIPNYFVEDTITSWWGYLIIILIIFSIIFFTLGSLKWRIILNDDSFTYVTYCGRRFIYKYSEVSSLSTTTHFIIMKVRKKYFFIDQNAIGIEKFLSKVKV